MTHIIMLKFTEGYLTEKVLEMIKTAFDAIMESEPEVLGAVFKVNCVERDLNLDLMIQVDLKEKDSLNKYLFNPYHVKLAKDMEPYMTGRASIDFE